MYYKSLNKTGHLKKIGQKIAFYFERLKTWGHARLTVMFIPHSEKKIFNFQISRFTIIFSLLIISLLVFTSIYAIKKQSSTSKRKAILQSENLSISGKLNSFISLTHKLEKRHAFLKKRLAKLLKTSGNNSKNIIFRAFPALNISAIAIPDSMKNKNMRFEYVNEVFKLNEIIKKIKIVNSRLREIKNQIKGFKQVMKGMPSIWPIVGGAGIFASPFGWRLDPFTRQPSHHPGVDILAMPGTPIRATADGVVITSDFHPGNGIYVNIRHKYGFVTNYSHMQKSNVKEGQTVKKGQIIGFIGNTGRSTGYHLHYEVRESNTQINPAPYLHLDRFFR